MDDRLLKRILDSLHRLKQRALTRKIGTVTDTSPFTVELSGVEHTGLPRIGGWTPEVGDRVWVSRSGQELLVHGKVDTNSYGYAELGYAEITSSDTQTGSGNKDITGLSLTVNVGSRPIRITFSGAVSNSSGSGATAVSIKEGSTTLGQAVWAGTTAVPMERSVRVSPSPGSHSYKINLAQVVTGNSTITASSAAPAWIWITEV